MQRFPLLTTWELGEGVAPCAVNYLADFHLSGTTVFWSSFFVSHKYIHFVRMFLQKVHTATSPEQYMHIHYNYLL